MMTVRNTTENIEKLKELISKNGGRGILHFGSLAGWPHTLARVSRELGIPSTNAVHTYKDVKDLDRKLPFDEQIFRSNDPFFKKIYLTAKYLKSIPEEFSVAHYHSSNLFHREIHFLAEGPYLKACGVPMVQSHGGGDGRIIEQARLNNPYFYKKYDARWDARVRFRWWSWSRFIDECASEPELAFVARDYFDRISVFHQPVDLKLFSFAPPSNKKIKPLILHVPTEPEVKGTEFVISAVEALKEKGISFEFKLARQLSQAEFFKLLAECDVYIDELRTGAHGMTAVEAMAMGKPTISWITEPYKALYPASLPLISSNPSRIKFDLEQLITNADMRHRIGIASREYVEKYHDAETVIDALSETYVRLLER